MQKVFFSTEFLDYNTLQSYGLTEDILMENAAAAMEGEVLKSIEKRAKENPFLHSRKNKSDLSVLILCGSGNNGGDGYALARRLYKKTLRSPHGKTPLTVLPLVYEVKKPKTPQCILQAKRAKKCGVPIVTLNNQGPFPFDPVEQLSNCVVVVDCIFGSGLKGEPDEKTLRLLAHIEQFRSAYPECFFLACDIPSGIASSSEVCSHTFRADVTISFGSYKVALFADAAKDYIGKIKIADLGVSRELFEDEDQPEETFFYMLEREDLQLPARKNQNVHKGSFGNTLVFSGEKKGAAILASTAAFYLGSGLVSVLHDEYSPGFLPEVVQIAEIPKNITAVCAGMGLGRENPAAKTFFSFAKENPNTPCVIDADLLYHKELPELLKNHKNCVLTPHPKEFSAILELCKIGKFSVEEVSRNRIKLCEEFCKKFPNTVLLLKGANTFICEGETIYINPWGINSLSKGGSGDTLAGFVAALLAQGYAPFEAATNASLIHTLAARKVKGASFSLEQRKLLQALDTLM